jgi:hypothetical protein
MKCGGPLVQRYNPTWQSESHSSNGNPSLACGRHLSHRVVLQRKQTLNEYQHPQACTIIFSLISRVWMQTQLLARGHYNGRFWSLFILCLWQPINMPQRSLREKETTGLASRKQAPKHNFTMPIWPDGGSELFIVTASIRYALQLIAFCAFLT